MINYNKYPPSTFCQTFASHSGIHAQHHLGTPVDLVDLVSEMILFLRIKILFCVILVGWLDELVGLGVPLACGEGGDEEKEATHYQVQQY